MNCPVGNCEYETDSEHGLKVHCARVHKNSKNPYKIECECKNCGGKFTVTKSEFEKHGEGVYCSAKCRDLGKRNRVETECYICSETFKMKKSKYNKCKNTYCSRECSSKGKTKNGTIICECNYCGEEFRVAKSNYKKGQGKYCSQKCYGLSLRSSNPDLRKSSEYRQFRETVLERDEYRCVKCGGDTDLHVHHIVPIYEDESLATDVENGKTLCVNCHADEHQQMGDNKVVALLESKGDYTGA